MRRAFFGGHWSNTRNVATFDDGRHSRSRRRSKVHQNRVQPIRTTPNSNRQQWEHVGFEPSPRGNLGIIDKRIDFDAVQNRRKRRPCRGVGGNRAVRQRPAANVARAIEDRRRVGVAKPGAGKRKRACSAPCHPVFRGVAELGRLRSDVHNSYRLPDAVIGIRRHQLDRRGDVFCEYRNARSCDMVPSDEQNICRVR